MKSLATKLWLSIRRNPVINAFFFAVATQIGHDFFANQIDWTNIVGYLAMVCLAVVTREFTVPSAEHAILKAEIENQPKAMIDPDWTGGGAE